MNDQSHSNLLPSIAAQILGGMLANPHVYSMLSLDSLALCDHVSAIRQSSLSDSPYGVITPVNLQRIQQGIMVAIGIF